MKVLKFVNSEYGYGTVDLITGPEPQKGWRVQSWKAKSGNPVPGRPDFPVVEQMDLICDASSHDVLAAHFQALDEMRHWAGLFRFDPTAGPGDRGEVWLHAKMDDESYERRALVNNVELKWRSQQIYEADGVPESRIAVQLEIEREPWWERTNYRAFPALSNTAAACVTYDYTGGGSPHDILGDVPARIRQLKIASNIGGANIGRMWIGVRSQYKHRDVDDFEPIWECEDTDATLGTDAARAADATASPTGGGDTKVTITPGTATWAKRLTITLGDITAADTDNLGFYLWLLRYKLSAGSSTWDAQLRFGYSGMADADFKRGPIVELANSSWDYAELAAQMFPIRGRYYEAVEEEQNTVQVWARRTTGAANLDLDCLIPLPIDEGWLKVTGVDVAAGSLEYVWFSEKPDGAVEMVEEASSEITGIGQVHSWHFRLPVGDGRMYLVYAGPSSSELTSLGIAVDTGTYTERWANLRGSSN